MKFYNVYHDIKNNVKLALMSLWTPGDHPMRQHIDELLSRESETVLQPPVFQSTFPWKCTDNEDWRNHLIPQIQQIIDNDNRTPYTHQAESFREANEGNSIVVTSGTGSGKTECFLYPVLSDIFKNAQVGGIQAIFLYPLNALMEDQRQRLADICRPLNISFAVYNGNTKEYRAMQNPLCPQELMTRQAIRNTPPNILLTNPSMLEYILVRDQDVNMINNSRRLKWIVIDEAHTYSGSSAVELGNQIKRVLNAFDVTLNDVQFACTSATIGDGSDPKPLVDFISQLTGQDPARIRVINGERHLPELDETELQQALVQVHPALTTENVLKLRHEINEKPGMRLPDIWKVIMGNLNDYSHEDALKLIDSLCEMRINDNPVLSLRAHYFMRTIDGIYTCLNPNCNNNRPATPMGRLTTHKASRCSCGAPLLELKQCKRCGTFEITGQYDNNTGLIRQGTVNVFDPIEEYSDVDDDGDELIAQDGNITSFVLSKHYQDYAPPRQNSINCFRTNISRVVGTNNQLRYDVDMANGDWVGSRNNNSANICPICARNESKLYSFRASAKQVNTWIAPVLLTESDAGHINPQNTRKFGKYIAFTDSRQGTAISAKLFNSNAERTHVWNQIIDYLVCDRLNNNGVIRPVRLNGDIQDRFLINKYFAHRSEHPGDERSYRKAIMRSLIGRRPVYEPSIENLGLVSVIFPQIDNIDCPDILERHDINVITRHEWHNFLKICVDYVLRFGNRLNPMSTEEKKYTRDSDMGSPLKKDDWPKLQINPDNTVSEKQNRIVLLLCAALGVHTTNDLDNNNRAIIEGLLNHAWNDLVNNRILTPTQRQDGYYLDITSDLSVARIKLNESAWICPVTKKLLDTIFCGYSPSMVGYLNAENIGRYRVTGEPVAIPTLNSNNIDIEQWLGTDRNVQNLRNLGLWDILYEQLFKCSEPYLTAEHSAQINRDTLRRYTDEFVNNRINVLNCSTTMEMGVDIGDIDIVLMDTVPPAAANYLQRAGRAGRKGQTKAIAFTLCNATPVGARAFENPMWAIESVDSMKQVVPSDTITQRHINAFFFRQFLIDPKRNQAGMRVRSTVTDFFDNGAFDDFLDFLDDIYFDANIEATFNEVFEGKPYRHHLSITTQAIIDIRFSYNAAIQELTNAHSAAAGNDLRQRAIRNQIGSLRNINLLQYLSENLFFPNANMPTGICTFDYSINEQTIQKSNIYDVLRQLYNDLNNANDDITRQIIKDNINAQFEALERLKREASRDMRTALNEYAPGQWVVINENNYKSEGIVFRNAFDAETYRRFFYRCSQCGYVYYGVSKPDDGICPNCGNQLTGTRNRNMLNMQNRFFVQVFEPIGFRTDPFASRNQKNKAERQYYNIQTELLHIDWAHPNRRVHMCELVCNDAKGEILYYNIGHGRGFAVCSCGKASVIPYNNDPSHMSGHRHLFNHNITCPETNIKRNVVLAGRLQTDYVAMHFKDSAGAYIQDTNFAISMGVILRRALASHLGVDISEIDFGWKNDEVGIVLYLFDTNRGGSNYSKQMTDSNVCQTVFSIALHLLESYVCHCEDFPGTACSSCLVDRDSQRLMSHLSKQAVLNWLREQANYVAPLPQPVKNFSNAAQRSINDVVSLAKKTVNDDSIHSVTFCFTDDQMDSSQWLCVEHQFGQIVHSLISRGKRVEFVLEYCADRHTTIPERLPFCLLEFECRNIHLRAVRDMGNFKTAMIIRGNYGIQRFFIDDGGTIPMNDTWGSCNELYFDSVDPQWDDVHLPTLNELYNQRNANEIIKAGEIFLNLNQNVRIDHLFNDAITPALQLNDQELAELERILNGQNVRINYSDRYVNSPLSCLMIVYLIQELRERFGFTIEQIDLQLSDDVNNTRWNDYTYIKFNYPNPDMRDNDLISRFRDVLDIEPTIYNDPTHYRTLYIENENGEYVDIRPDHGISGGWNHTGREQYQEWLLLDGSVRVTKHDEDDILYYLLTGRNNE